MVQLQTAVKVKPANNSINYTSKIVLLGSCFAENIGEKLSYYKFTTTCNPFGILFHPLAINKVIARAINDEKYTEKDIFFENEQWHCFEAHSQVSCIEKMELLARLNYALIQLKNAVELATHIILTYGTAWVYRHIETDTIVANCHKVPQKEFVKELLSPQQIVENSNAIQVLVRTLNPNVQFIYTVSPVRHVKDGLIENSQSKAHLLTGVHHIVNDNAKKASYFPSFEIMMDELRDYRFYKEDLIHPSKTAISIIWNRFNEVYISAKTLSLQKEIEGIQKGLQHRPFNENTQAHKNFKIKLQERINKIIEVYPHIQF